MTRKVLHGMNLPFDADVSMFSWFGEFNLNYALTKAPRVFNYEGLNHIDLDLLFDIQGNDRDACELPYDKRESYVFGLPEDS
jgi:hypothetical protein